MQQRVGTNVIIITSKVHSKNRCGAHAYACVYFLMYYKIAIKFEWSSIRLNRPWFSISINEYTLFVAFILKMVKQWLFNKYKSQSPIPCLYPIHFVTTSFHWRIFNPCLLYMYNEHLMKSSLPSLWAPGANKLCVQMHQHVLLHLHICMKMAWKIPFSQDFHDASKNKYVHAIGMSFRLKKATPAALVAATATNNNKQQKDATRTNRHWCMHMHIAHIMHTWKTALNFVRDINLISAANLCVNTMSQSFLVKSENCNISKLVDCWTTATLSSFHHRGICWSISMHNLSTRHLFALIFFRVCDQRSFFPAAIPPNAFTKCIQSNFHLWIAFNACEYASSIALEMLCVLCIRIYIIQ